MDIQTFYKIQRLKLFHDGHSFAELDSMSFEDFGDVIGYTAELTKGEEKLRGREKALKGKS